jgi:hypothetical protein
MKKRKKQVCTQTKTEGKKQTKREERKKHVNTKEKWNKQGENETRN